MVTATGTSFCYALPISEGKEFRFHGQIREESLDSKPGSYYATGDAYVYPQERREQPAPTWLSGTPSPDKWTSIPVPTRKWAELDAKSMVYLAAARHRLNGQQKRVKVHDVMVEVDFATVEGLQEQSARVRLLSLTDGSPVRPGFTADEQTLRRAAEDWADDADPFKRDLYAALVAMLPALKPEGLE